MPSNINVLRHNNVHPEDAGAAELPVTRVQIKEYTNGVVFSGWDDVVRAVKAYGLGELPSTQDRDISNNKQAVRLITGDHWQIAPSYEQITPRHLETDTGRRDALKLAQKRLDAEWRSVTRPIRGLHFDDPTYPTRLTSVTFADVPSHEKAEMQLNSLLDQARERFDSGGSHVTISYHPMGDTIAIGKGSVFGLLGSAYAKLLYLTIDAIGDGDQQRYRLQLNNDYHDKTVEHDMAQLPGAFPLTDHIAIEADLIEENPRNSAVDFRQVVTTLQKVPNLDATSLSAEAVAKALAPSTLSNMPSYHLGEVNGFSIALDLGDNPTPIGLRRRDNKSLLKQRGPVLHGSLGMDDLSRPVNLHKVRVVIRDNHGQIIDATRRKEMIQLAESFQAAFQPRQAA